MASAEIEGSEVLMDIEEQWIIRRLQPEEALAIKDFSHQDKFKSYYPRHSEWLARALEQLHTGERVAFGAFPPRLPIEKFFSEPEAQLAASVILKISPYTSTIELKNWILDERVIGHDDLNEVRTKLLKRVESYSQRKGFRHLQLELPPEEKDTIAFLFSKSFSIASIASGKYRQGDYLYVFEKRLFPRYVSDPFDFQEIVRWILLSYYPQFQTALYSSNDAHSLDQRRFSCVFELTGPDILTESDSRKIADRARLDGWAVAVEDASKPTEINALFPSARGFRLLFAMHIGREARSLYQATGIQPFDSQDIDIFLGRNDSVDSVYFKKEDIGGMIVTVGPKYFHPMRQREMLGGDFVYFLLSGGIGRNAAPGVPEEIQDPDKKRLVLFYFPTISQYSQGLDRHPGIYFYAEITHRTIDKPGVLWEEADEDAQPLLIKDKEQLLFYTRYSESREIVALHCTGLTRLTLPIDFPKLIRDSDGPEARDFYYSELTASGIVTSYITKQCRDFFYSCLQKTKNGTLHEQHTDLTESESESESMREMSTSRLGKRGPSVKNHPFDVALSYPGTLRPLVSRIASCLRDQGKSVFYDEFFEAQLGKPHIIPDLKRVYQERSDLVVVIFGPNYRASPWCGLEWSVVEKLIFSGRASDVMLLKAGAISNDELDPGDHYIDINSKRIDEICELITSRQGKRGLEP